jgi:hypothetical protein
MESELARLAAGAAPGDAVVSDSAMNHTETAGQKLKIEN